MTPIAPHITAFLRERLPVELGASQNTCDSYAYTFQLLFQFASSRLGRTPSALSLEQIDAALVMDFLRHLELERGNSPTTRNARLAAIKSFMRFVELRVPSILEQSMRILAIPAKRTDSRLVNHLSTEEMHAILEAPDVTTWAGVRDRAMLHLCYCCGLRVSELVGLPLSGVSLSTSPSIRVHGKGRRERSLPLWKGAAGDLRAWLAIRGEPRAPELFVNMKREAMTRSGFEYILRKHVETAATRCPTLTSKTVSPHVLRHTCAMTVLQATGDLRKVSLWLGHSQMQTTEVYVRADSTEKLEVVNNMALPTLRRGRFNVPDKLLASFRSR